MAIKRKYMMAASIALVFVLVTGSRPKPRGAVAPLPFPVPKGWPAPLYPFKDNPPTEAGFELGRRLFYDGRLSQGGNFPCASCHQPFAAFATFDHDRSHGAGEGLTVRNAPGLANLAWRKDFMADGSVADLAAQPSLPINAPHEMGSSMRSIIGELKADSVYPKLFQKAFGSPGIDSTRLLKALAQFMVMLVSADSKYDRAKRGEDSFILPERLGESIFMAKCASCHPPPMFTDGSFRNIGMPRPSYLTDLGRMQVTGDPRDSLRFRVPSLRNVALTKPYGHDGRWPSLLNVLEHYRKQVAKGPTTDPAVANGIPLNNYEMGQLMAFLFTLTDSAFIASPRFSDPFAQEAQKAKAHLH